MLSRISTEDSCGEGGGPINPGAGPSARPAGSPARGAAPRSFRPFATSGAAFMSGSICQAQGSGLIPSCASRGVAGSSSFSRLATFGASFSFSAICPGRAQGDLSNLAAHSGSLWKMIPHSPFLSMVSNSESARIFSPLDFLRLRPGGEFLLRFRPAEHRNLRLRRFGFPHRLGLRETIRRERLCGRLARFRPIRPGVTRRGGDLFGPFLLETVHHVFPARRPSRPGWPAALPRWPPVRFAGA